MEWNILSVIGLDIGGTKCSVSRADQEGKLLEKKSFFTSDAKTTLDELITTVASMDVGPSPVFGISCGGPLDSKRGLILSPPNLPGWNEIPIVKLLADRFGGKAFLMNDANAGVLAEWKFGAARGHKNVIFLTHGTGMGAGIVLNNRLYEGTSGMAGEVGHIRLEPDGPVGYNKAGSFEGFCGGAGIARLAQQKARELNGKVSFNKGRIDEIATKEIAQAAKEGDAIAREIFTLSGHYLGMALSILIDILNPEIIVLGTLFVRCRDLLEPSMMKALQRESLSHSLSSCRIVPAGLGEQIGDYAAVSVALYKSRCISTMEPI